MLPKISVITPSLNQGQFIETTIKSVLSQDYSNLEYIIMDGGSTDNTLSILRSYEDRLRWYSEKDKGQSNAINKGLNMAEGDIQAYLNADDLLLPGALHKVAQVFIDQPEVMWLTGRCRIIDEQGRETRKLITAYKNLLLKMHRRSLLLVTDYISQPATFWRVQAYHNLGSFDERLHFAMDYEYWLRLASRYRLLVLDENLAAFRIHARSKNTNAGHMDPYVEEEKAIILKYTNSKWMRFLHNFHRWFMTAAYSRMSRSARQ